MLFGCDGKLPHVSLKDLFDLFIYDCSVLGEAYLNNNSLDSTLIKAKLKASLEINLEKEPIKVKITRDTFFLGNEPYRLSKKESKFIKNHIK